MARSRGLGDVYKRQDFYVANATAHQRAKAFLITKGQWKESYGPAADPTSQASVGRADSRELYINQLEKQNRELGEKIAARSSAAYSSDQATNCAGCGAYKHTPLRRDEMGGYVCLTCIDKELDKHLPHD
jgi:hypothetical protein